jgi:hypothetical protein
MEGKEWYIRQRIWALTGYQKEDASEGKQIARHYVRSKTGWLSSGIRNPEDTCMPCIAVQDQVR